MDKLKGAKAIVQINYRGIVTVLTLALAAAFFAACGTTPAGNSSMGGVDPNETAAKVNGKVITMEEVDRAVKQQTQGQDSKLSALEVAGARLQVLQSLVEQEVMFQKAEKDNLVPTDEEITLEVNKRKVDSRLSAEEFNKQMEQAGMNEKALRENIKKGLAIQKLVDKITGRIETPKDSEIEAFFNGNPEMFVKKRGVRLAAIVVDPTDTGQGDVTKNAAEADQKVKEIIGKVSQPGSDFAALAREYSEDGSKLQGGDLGYISEQDLKQNFGEQIAAAFMNPTFEVGRITSPIPLNGKAYIFKLQERIEKEETLTLESPDVRPQINQLLVDNRKQLLAASYQAMAMNEAKIENYLAKKVVDNPNELSGARPAGATTPANTAAPANANAAASNANASNSAPAANANAKPAANANADAKPAANANK
ncbi:MAG: SurA N-terminal domain-containing protein [Pyrinomonadaceae bacterium]